MLVKMTPSECAIAQMLALMRNATARNNGVTDKQMGKQDPIEIDRDGMLAEMAFGKAFNLYPDLSVFPRKGGADLIGRTGKKIDVKATRYKNGRLAIHIDKSVDEVDIYVLAIVEGNDVDLVGYIDSASAIRKENVRSLGYGNGYIVEQDSLTKFKK